MSGKGTYTSRERIALIVVAGLVIIAITAMVIYSRNDSQPQVQQTVATVTTTSVHDSDVSKPDSAAKAEKKHKKRHRKAAEKKAKKKQVPKPRDYFTSPENE